MEDKLCPVCINNEAECFTECNHGYCVTCLCRIEKCALCRKKLNRRVLNSQITFHYIMKHSRKNVVSRNDSVVSRGERISEREGIYVDPENYQPNRTDPPWRHIENTPWSFALDPEHTEPSGYVGVGPRELEEFERYQPSGTQPMSRIPDWQDFQILFPTQASLISNFLRR